MNWKAIDFVDYNSLYITVDLVNERDDCALSGAWQQHKSGRNEFAIAFNKKCEPIFGAIWNALEGQKESRNPDEIRAMFPGPFYEEAIQRAIDAVYEW